MSDEQLADSSFSVKLEGVKAVILFPSLVTPCLVDRSGKMTVIIAVHKTSFEKLRHIAGNFIKEGKDGVSVEVAVKLHSHLYMAAWGANYVSVKNKNAYLGHFRDLTRPVHLIYHDHNKAREMYVAEHKPFRVCYLGELSAKLVSPLLCTYTGKKDANGKDANVPLGRIEDSARELYESKGYLHVFQMEFSEFTTAEMALRDPEQNHLHELVWVWGDSAGIVNKVYSYEKPADTLLLHNFEKNHNKTEGKPLLEPNVDAAPREIMDKPWWIPDALGGLEPLNMYRLLDPGTGPDPHPDNPDNKPKGPLDELPAMKQNGAHLLLARHPVLISGKEHLKIGVIGDLHISARQSLYKLTHAQVIPGASQEDSPYIGQMSNEFLRSSREVMTNVLKTCDMLAIVGDIIDHDRNLYPKNAAKQVKKTGALWKYVNFKDNEKKGEIYPQHIDAIMMLELVLQCYDQGRPVFFITGNHEAYEKPYGISPRLELGGMELMRVNEGIPADHNLTIYEAALLYGETYNECTWFNFDKDRLEWYYQVFSPWSDIVVSHGNYNFVFLCWGTDEGYVKSFLEGGKTLPRSYGAITKEQLKLLAYAGAQADTKTNILFSHFTYISYDPLLPLKNTTGGPNEGTITIGESRISKAGGVVSAAGVVFTPARPYTTVVGAGMGVVGEKESAFCETNLGSFTKKLHKVFSLLSTGSIQYTVSGHAHRGCAYAINGTAAQGKEWAMLAVRALSKQYLTLAWDAVTLGQNAAGTSVPVAPILPERGFLPGTLTLPKDRTVSLVTGSAGPMCVQNIEGELGGLGLDTPQGMVFSPGSNQAQIVRAAKPKPRLAAVAAALQDIRKIYPLSNKTVGTTGSDNNFYVEMSEKWWDIFGGCPFHLLKVHGVFSDGSKGVCNAMELTVKAVEGLKVYFNQTADDFDEFYSDVKRDAKNKPIDFFISMHFSGTHLRDNKFIKNYDLSPWSFPVEFDETWFSKLPRFTYKAQELPDYVYYKDNFKEYK